METVEIIFWGVLGVVFYAYVGYGIVLFGLVQLKKLFVSKKAFANPDYEPEVTLLVAAYNEKDSVCEKVRNTYALNYPQHKLHQIWVTDGSNDGTPDQLASDFPKVLVLHEPTRNGKIAAMNRGMQYVKTPIVIFSDANTILGADSVQHIVEMFKDPKVGCVSGEKRIYNHTKDAAAAAGEGLYWKYESKLKAWDAQLNSAVGAAGELFAIRSDLFQTIEADTILDDFIISLRVAMKGYTIQYNPEAFAIESASVNVKEELKRKVRIAAGGIQSIIRLYPLLNIFRYRLLSFQYISHRVLRWSVAPLGLPIIFILNAFLYNVGAVYANLFYLQCLFYLMAAAGYLAETFKTRFKPLFVPYYFFIMNYAVYRGFIRFVQKKQSVNWVRAKRDI